jgi:LPS export ABC transporter protein LptC
MMHRLASRILIGVALFVVLVAGILVARSRSVRSEPAEPQPSPADLHIKQVEVREESAGGGRWRLLADQASVFDQEGRTALRNVKVYVEDKDRRWMITGEEGDFFKDRKDLEVRRNVVMVSEDGMRLETTVLRWRAADRHLWTDVPVRILRADGVVIDGTAFDANMNDEATLVKGRVHARFGERDPR